MLWTEIAERRLNRLKIFPRSEPQLGIMQGLADKIYRKRSDRFTRLFTGYSQWLLARNFHTVGSNESVGKFCKLNGPLLIYSNHCSWWDPLVFLFLAKQFFPHYVGFGPMDAVALKKYAFMQRLGIFGIESGTVSGGRRFLQVSESLLSESRVMLWVTAQGQFADPRRRPVELQAGIAHLAKRVHDLTIIPLAIEYPFWVERYPEVLVQFGDSLRSSDFRDMTVQNVLEQQTRCLNLAMDHLAEKAIAQDPALFNALLSGSVGVGGIYDAFNQFAASLSGRRYKKAHSDVMHDADA